MASNVPKAKSPAKGASSSRSSTSSRPGSPAPRRGGSGPRSGKSPAGDSKAKPASPEAPEPKKPVIKTSELPTLSLIDEPAPKRRTVSTARALPRIGEEQPAPPIPVADPSPEAEAAPSSSAEPDAAPEADIEDPRKIIHIKPPIQIKELAARMEIPAFKIIKDLMGMQIFANINQSVEPDIAAKLCELYGFLFEREKRVAGAGVHKEEKVVV